VLNFSVDKIEEIKKEFPRNLSREQISEVFNPLLEDIKYYDQTQVHSKIVRGIKKSRHAGIRRFLNGGKMSQRGLLEVKRIMAGLRLRDLCMRVKVEGKRNNPRIDCPPIRIIKTEHGTLYNLESLIELGGTLLIPAFMTSHAFERVKKRYGNIWLEDMRALVTQTVCTVPERVRTEDIKKYDDVIFKTLLPVVGNGKFEGVFFAVFQKIKGCLAIILRTYYNVEMITVGKLKYIKRFIEDLDFDSDEIYDAINKAIKEKDRLK